MTIKELEEIRDKAARYYDTSRETGKNAKNLYSLLAQLKKPGQDKDVLEKLYTDATTQLGYIIQAQHDVETIAREYRYHIDSIMRATKITWPPRCLEKEG